MIEIEGMSVERILCKNTYTTNITKRIASTNVFITFLKEASRKSLELIKSTNSIPLGEKDYENLVIKSLASGEVLRLKDVARIELGSRTYTYIGEVNGHPGSNCMIAQTSGSNANEIIEEVDKVVAEISKSLPKGMELVDFMSSKDFLDASIKNVIKPAA